MPVLPYSATPPASRPEPQDLPPLLLGGATDPSGYLPDTGLVDAVNTALILRQPLLLTGEPGTGKSQLAASVAYQLGLDPPLAFETKSTAVARDLFYSFDNIGRFRAVQVGTDQSRPTEFISYNALGLAILCANPEADVRPFVPASFVHGGQRRSVVLIDEIDKAPRDFPNDILNEIERLFFRIPELGNAVISADDEFRPAVIMTSNSEKTLPDAFLRRCIFYSIPFPDQDRLERIVLARLAGHLRSGAPLLRDTIDFFLRLRDRDTGLRKRPGTAELLNWLAALLALGCDPGEPLKSQVRMARATLPTLSKLVEDQERVADAFAGWATG